ncbi:MAG: c-type cytochrome [Gammaproteobacteria bacterium]|nr:c-type cytochrome [Gammaproteobacteria bacterium]
MGKRTTKKFLIGAVGGLMASGLASLAMADGKAVYEAGCVACHAEAVAGAPKFGDAAAWKDRIARGNDALYENAIKGYTGSAGMMPPKGGFAHLSDDEVKSAVDYMVESAK